MKIAILLPYKENFSPTYAGAVSLYVKDTTLKSKYKNIIRIFGSTNYKNVFNLAYINLNIKKNLITSGSKQYVDEFLKQHEVHKSEIIEIHNRPIYLKYIRRKIEAKIVLYFHNDPLTMSASKSIEDRRFLFDYSEKIVFNSEWSKKRFLEGMDPLIGNSDKLIVIYQSSNLNKINFSKKEKLITFVGKLNTAKGYDLFGAAIIRILKKFSDWRAIVIGDEPREQLVFNHPRLEKLGFVNHKEVLKIYSKSSIAVACSRWNEPLGRTSLEASSRGCAVIISNRGGLPETITHGIILKKLSVKNVYESIKSLVINKKKMKELQKLSYDNFHHTHSAAINEIDKYREFLLTKRNYFFTSSNNKQNLKILHVTNFNERHDGRLFFNTGRRLNNGFIRLNHSVLDFSDRDILKHYKNINDFNGAKTLNQKLISTVHNYKPDLLIFGHADLISNQTLSTLKKNYPNVKLSQWFLDRMDGVWEKNKYRFLSKLEYMDANFITTSPTVLKFLPKDKKIYFIPNPADKSFETLDNYTNKNCIYDVFFALSHGVHRGVLKRGKYDAREKFIKNLIKITPNIKFDIYGINKIQPVWADTFYNSLKKSKMAINLSQGIPIKHYSSDRITQLVGNGLLTFIDERTFYRNFFTNNEMIFYSNINDLSEKIYKYSRDEKLRMNVAKNGKEKYLKYFNSTVVAEYIINKTFEVNYKKNKYLWEK